MGRRSFLAALAGLAVVAGCGDDQVTVGEVRDCLRDAGYAAVQRPGSEVLHTTGQVDLSRGRFRAAIYFFDSEAAAGDNAVPLGRTLAASGGGLAVQRGPVVIGYGRRPARAERDRVEGCL